MYFTFYRFLAVFSRFRRGAQKGCHIFTYVVFANKPNDKEQLNLFVNKYIKNCTVHLFEHLGQITILFLWKKTIYTSLILLDSPFNQHLWCWGPWWRLRPRLEALTSSSRSRASSSRRLSSSLNQVKLISCKQQLGTWGYMIDHAIMP